MRKHLTGIFKWSGANIDRSRIRDPGPILARLPSWKWHAPPAINSLLWFKRSSAPSA